MLLTMVSLVWGSHNPYSALRILIRLNNIYYIYTYIYIFYKKANLLEIFSKKIHIKSKTIPEVTETDRILRSKAMKSANNFELNQDQEETNCNKDTTGLVTMNTYSRGHLFYVTSGGIIRFWSPLYRSESTSQVAIPTIKYLELYIREYKNIDDTYLFYDNMVRISFLLNYRFYL